tara:strand:+ start:153 stop:308 length:156 start_codon:yes stop_codon:yes gene_type:complete
MHLKVLGFRIGDFAYVNDVLTTGATLRICRDILEDNGRIVLGAAVLALAEV